MKTLILYETKKGCTKKCAEVLHHEISNSELFQLHHFDGNIIEYDRFIVLSPIYMGQINKKIKEFLTSNTSTLLKHPLRIGLCGMNKSGFNEVIDTQFNDDIMNHATIELIGGAYYFDKLHFLQRFIVKKIAKVHESVEEIDYQALHQLVK